MTGEQDLTILRRQMSPRLHDGTYVYCCFADFKLPPGLQPMCTVLELEGLTAVVEKSAALERGAPFVFESRLITLTIHSSLEAIGFTALVAGRLAEEGIACNAMAGYHHDHLLVPAARADDAMRVLRELSSE